MRDTKTDDLIEAIVDRARPLFSDLGVNYSRMNIWMDLEAANRDIPIDFERLLHSDLGTFGHDIGGIRRFLNRETGKIEQCFMPKTARPIQTH